MTRKGYYLGWLLLAFVLVLIGCSESTSDMQSYIAQTKARKPKPLEPLPEFKQYQALKYTAAKLRNPFEPYIPTQAEIPTEVGTGPGPDLRRPKEALERFPLDALKMVGTIARGKMKFALVKDPQGLIHRVGIGNYMGLNYGKIENITDGTIDIREWITVQGKYTERTVSIKLSS